MCVADERVMKGAAAQQTAPGTHGGKSNENTATTHRKTQVARECGEQSIVSFVHEQCDTHQEIVAAHRFPHHTAPMTSV